MNVLQPYDRDIPEQEDKTEEDQTSENQKPDENSLLGFNVQCNLIRSELSVRLSSPKRLPSARLLEPRLRAGR